MNASELNRKLLYCGYTDVTDHLKNSPLNRHIYRDFLTLLPEHRVEVLAVKLLNEVFYQMVRIPRDVCPGERVQKRYIDECADWLGSTKAADLVFSMVSTLMYHKKKLLFEEELFLQQLNPLIGNCEFFKYVSELNEMMGQYGYYTPDCQPMPCPVNEIPMKGVTSAWRDITYNYTYKLMRMYVMLYPSVDEQQELMKRIMKSCPLEDYDFHRRDFDKLCEEITNGGAEVKKSKEVDNHHGREVRVIENEDGDTTTCIVADRPIHACMLLSQEEEEQLKKYWEQIRKKSIEEAVQMYLSDKDSKEEEALGRIEEVKRQNGSLDSVPREKHEREINELKSNYQAEIDDLKRQLEQKQLDCQVAQCVDAVSVDFNLPVSEMITVAKERFSKTGADELYGMLCKLAVKHGYMSEPVWQMLDGIVPAILQRDAHHQTINIPTAQQVNINPKEVINTPKEE